MTSERKKERQLYANQDTILRTWEEIKKQRARIDELYKRLEKLERKDNA